MLKFEKWRVKNSIVENPTSIPTASTDMEVLVR
jgi:hypothetical protein